MKNKNKILLMIGARGGSKGVKGKNIRPLLGRPLISYTIAQALKWGKAERVVVSTDSEEIAKVARKYGADVPFLRPGNIAGDKAPKSLVIKHCLLECEKKFNEKYKIIVDLDATAPIRTTQDLDNCLKIFLKQKPDTLFSVVESHKSPYFNMVEKDKNGKVRLAKKLKSKIFCRQDSPKVYAMNASIYFYDRDYVVSKELPTPLSKKIEIYVMDDVCGIDIDREIDFKYIEFLLKQKIVRL